MSIGVPIVTCLPILYQQCINRQKQSKTVKSQSKQQKWPLVYQSLHVYQDCTNSVPIVKNSQKQPRHSKQQKWPLVYRSSHVYQDCTNRVPTVYQSSKTVKRQSKQQNYHWCTNHHRVCLIHKVCVRVCVSVRRIHKAPIGSRFSKNPSRDP